MVAEVGTEELLDFAMFEVNLQGMVRHVRKEWQRDECCKVRKLHFASISLKNPFWFRTTTRPGSVDIIAVSRPFIIILLSLISISSF